MPDKISIIHKSLKIRLYPSEDQKILFNKVFGCCRFVYNKHKEEKDNFYNENIKDKNLSKKAVKPSSVLPFQTPISNKILFTIGNQVRNQGIQPLFRC